MQDSRPVYLILIDGWAPRWLAREMANLPNLSRLAAAGACQWQVCSTFPSVTPTAIATLVTGVSPMRHGIRGILWYHLAEDRYVHYWPSPERLWHGGWSRMWRDIVVDLNARHLSRDALTLFETLDGSGLRVASINMPVHRGPVMHPVRVPGWLQRMGRFEPELELMGPRHWVWGEFTSDASRVGLAGLHGLTDAFSIEAAVRMIREVSPDFMAIYLGDHDGHSHRLGPDRCGASLRRIDGLLGRLMDAHGSSEKAVQRARWILVGDHAQTRLYGGGASIDLARLLATRFNVASLVQGGLLAGDPGLAVAPNDRMAYIHASDPLVFERVRAFLIGVPAIALVAWSEEGRTVCMETDRKRRLAWWPGRHYRDSAGQRWGIEGDLEVLDCRVEGSILHWGRFPDAFERLRGALDRPGDLVVVAREGHEFHTGLGMGRGNHGGLCSGDSLVPMISVGMPPLEGFVRLQDIATWIVSAFR